MIITAAFDAAAENKLVDVRADTFSALKHLLTATAHVGTIGADPVTVPYRHTCIEFAILGTKTRPDADLVIEYITS